MRCEGRFLADADDYIAVRAACVEQGLKHERSLETRRSPCSKNQRDKAACAKRYQFVRRPRSRTHALDRQQPDQPAMLRGRPLKRKREAERGLADAAGRTIRRSRLLRGDSAADMLPIVPTRLRPL